MDKLVKIKLWMLGALILWTVAIFAFGIWMAFEYKNPPYPTETIPFLIGAGIFLLIAEPWWKFLDKVDIEGKIYKWIHKK